MISVIVPTLNSGRTLAATLTALIPAVISGLIREVIIADGGSADRTLAIADQSGADIVVSAPGRGVQLRAGAARATMPWLLFLHADTELEPGWEREADALIERVSAGGSPDQAASFRFRLDDSRFAARLIEAGVELRSSVLRLPYGDQGLLISRSLYTSVGGFADIPIMEDINLIRRVGRNRLRMLNARATTSAMRYQNEGYVKRVLRNQRCLLLYLMGASPERIARIYNRPGS